MEFAATGTGKIGAQSGPAQRRIIRRHTMVTPETATVDPLAVNSLSSGLMSQFELPDMEAQRLAAERRAARMDLCRPALTLRLLLALQAVLALVAMALSTGPLDWLLRIAHLAFVGLTGAVLWLPAVCALRQRLPRWPASVSMLVVCLLGGVAGLAAWAQSALWAGLAWTLGSTAWPALGGAACGAGLAAAAWTWLSMRATSGGPAEASARLAELQSRIRPHFLFNALNTALVLVQVDPVRAETVLEDLALLFRAALAETGAEVSLDEEVALAQRYLAIEQLRYGSRLQVSWLLDPAAGRARLPPLVLQPLVENAVRHGIEALAAGGQITVRTRAKRGMATVSVSNSVPEPPAATLSAGAGMALDNVRERLRLLHDMAGSLQTWREPGLFHARIAVPLT